MTTKVELDKKYAVACRIETIEMLLFILFFTRNPR